MSDVVPFAAMVFSEGVTMGISTISKAAMTQGLSTFVLVVYSDALATLLLFPFFFFKRSLLSLSSSLQTHAYMTQGVNFIWSSLLQEQATSSYLLSPL